MSAKKERLSFQSGLLTLEARFQPPLTARAPGVVICHPHPLFGGSMDNNVVEALEYFSAKNGLATLAFNFRGVGQSQGKYDHMKGEVEDVIAAINYLAQRPEVDPHRLALAGYSFGGLMALSAWHQLQTQNLTSDRGQTRGNLFTIKALVLISPMPPAGGWRRAFPNLSALPTLLVNGDQDQFCQLESARELLSLLGAPAQLLLVKNADHFYLGLEEEAASPAADFLKAKC